jgi:transcriptional regulator with XRE-family HTH domain
MLTFGERLAVLRRRKGLTQQEVADQAAITANTLARVERGRVKMLRGDTVAALADVLGTTTDYLLGRTEESGVESEWEPAAVA